MGRMFDVLRQAEATRDAGEAPTAPTSAPEDFVFDATNEEVPFIEVGPARSVEASPAVLAVQSPRLRIAPFVEAQRDAEADRPRDGDTLAPSVRPSTPAASVSLRALPARAPEQRFAPDLIAYHHPDHPSAAEYRAVAAALLAPGTSGVRLCMGIADAVGTTSVVLNLAVCLATTAGLRVIVVDANVSRPAVAERLGLRGRPGLAEVLDGSESLDRVLQPTGVERLTALTAGQFDGHKARAKIGEACRPVLRLLRDRCDVVLIDGGLDADDLGRISDAVYLVVPQVRADDAATTERSWALLHQGVPLCSCIVTGR
jgi:Mrp family chromosome partitioning ATPase